MVSAAASIKSYRRSYRWHRPKEIWNWFHFRWLTKSPHSSRTVHLQNGHRARPRTLKSGQQNLPHHYVNDVDFAPQFGALTISFVFVRVIFGRMSSHTQYDDHNEKGHQDTHNAANYRIQIHASCRPECIRGNQKKKIGKWKTQSNDNLQSSIEWNRVVESKKGFFFSPHAKATDNHIPFASKIFSVIPATSFRPSYTNSMHISSVPKSKPEIGVRRSRSGKKQIG